MSLFIPILIFFLIISFVLSIEYINLSPEDKEFLLDQLPNRHKLSIPMQQILNQSQVPVIDDRSKRQYMVYRPPQPSYIPQPVPNAPSYQLNLPIITPVTQQPYVLVAPPPAEMNYMNQMQTRGVFDPYALTTTEQLIWDMNGLHNQLKHFPTRIDNLNLDELVNSASFAAFTLRKDSLGKTLGTTGSPTPLVETTQGTKTKIESTLSPSTAEAVESNLSTVESTMLTAPTTKMQQVPRSINSVCDSIITPTLPSCESNHAEVNKMQITSQMFMPSEVYEPQPAQMDSDISSFLNKPEKNFQLSAYNPAECKNNKNQQNNAINSLPLQNSKIAEIIQSNTPTPPPNTLRTTRRRTTTTPTTTPKSPSDAVLRDKLTHILEGVENIKSNNNNASSINEGLPCSIEGTWVSALAGSGFHIEKKRATNLNIPLVPISCDGFMKTGDWQVTMSTPLADVEAGIFVLTAVRPADYNMATFTGECRTCNNEEEITGHWLVVKPAECCEEMNRGEDFFGDTWKKCKRNM